MDEWDYSARLTAAVRTSLRSLALALEGKDSQELQACPYRLGREDMRAVRLHLAAITNVVGSARLVPVAEARAERGSPRTR